MPRRNRVNPFSEIEATSARGTLMGNRGQLHQDGEMTNRRWTWKFWISCELNYKNVRRPLMAPNTYTELFFLDEVTALAAGHRPCALCRRPDFKEFQKAWAAEFGAIAKVTEIDELLHRERVPMIDGDRPEIEPITLADFAMFELEERAFVKVGKHGYAWSHEGYGTATPLPETARLITPPTLVKLLDRGYVPRIHASLREQISSF